MDPIVVVNVKDKDTPAVGISGAAPIPSLHARESTRDSFVTLHHDGDLHDDSSNLWQILDSLITDVATLRIEFNEYRSSFSPPSPLDD